MSEVKEVNPLSVLKQDDVYTPKEKEKINIFSINILHQYLTPNEINNMKNEVEDEINKNQPNQKKNQKKNQSGGNMMEVGAFGVDLSSIMLVILGILSSLPDTNTHVNPIPEQIGIHPVISVLLGCFLIVLRAKRGYSLTGGKRNNTKRGGTLRRKRNIRKFRKTNRS
jgi:hypothetical protein